MQQVCGEERDYGFGLVKGTGQGCRYESDCGFERVEGTEKIINGDTCCHNSFGMLEGCAEEEGGDEVLTSETVRGFDFEQVRGFHFEEVRGLEFEKVGTCYLEEVVQAGRDWQFQRGLSSS